MSIDLDLGPLEDLEPSRTNDVEPPYAPGVALLYDGDQLVAMLTPTRARRLAYRILATLEDAHIAQADKLLNDRLIEAGIIPPDKPKLTVV